MLGSGTPIRAAEPRNPIDVHVGARLLQMRMARNMTREQLAQRIGIDVARLRAHENGAVRIDAARMLAIARVFDVPTGSFFDGLL